MYSCFLFLRALHFSLCFWFICAFKQFMYTKAVVCECDVLMWIIIYICLMIYLSCQLVPVRILYIACNTTLLQPIFFPDKNTYYLETVFLFLKLEHLFLWLLICSTYHPISWNPYIFCFLSVLTLIPYTMHINIAIIASITLEFRKKNCTSVLYIQVFFLSVCI